MEPRIDYLKAARDVSTSKDARIEESRDLRCGQKSGNE
jgi:hypothetical protein